jgi:hypothetical protein
MVDITEISAMVAAAGVLIGVVYYILDMRNQTKQRQMDMVMRLYSTFMSKELSESLLVIMGLEYRDYNDFVEKYGMPSPEKPVWIAYMMVTNFFNEVGMLLHRKFIDIESVDELFAFRVALFWEKLKPLIEDMRKQLKGQVGDWFEYVYDEMKKREQRK